MPGEIIEVSVTEGENISEGQTLFVLEAMKMENTIQAPSDGTVHSIHVKENEKVIEGQLLAKLGGTEQ